jgi:hypothetical protein
MEILNLNECASFNFLAQSSKRKAKSHSVKLKVFNFELWFYALHFTLFAILASLYFFISPAAQAAVGPNWIEQWGITWTFDKNISTDGAGDTYQYGQFVNGDYWIKGPVNIISINPPCHVTVAGEKDKGGRDYTVGTIINGSMLNPSPGSSHGYASHILGYSAQLNVALDVPLEIQTGSLISTQSKVMGSGQGDVSGVQFASVLTVLASAPNAGSFRPPYCGTTKTVSFNKSVFDKPGKGYSLLLSLPHADAPALSELATISNWFARPWIDHVGSFQGRLIHPVDNMVEYGAAMHNYISFAAIALHLNYTNAQKESLLVNYVQLGIDFYGIVQAGGTGNWVCDGGHSQGRKWPIIFAGLMLGDEGMQAIGEKSGDYLYSAKPGGGNYGPGETTAPPDYIYFGEDDQTFYVAQLDIDITNSSAFNPDYRDTEKIPYSGGDLGLPEWGIRHALWPQASNKWLPTIYRSVVGPSFAGTALAALMMTQFDKNGRAVSGAKLLWNHDAYFDYVDRWVGLTNIGGELYGSDSGVSSFVRTVWATYRADYGPIWPDKGVVMYGDISADSALSAYDAALCARIAVGLDAYPTGDNLTKVDVSGDGFVTAYDAALIAQKAVGLITKFPVES